MNRLAPLCVLAFFLLAAVVNADVIQGPQIGPSATPATVSQASITKVATLANNMYNRWYALDQACDPRAVFAVAYLWMTHSALNLIQNNYFDDGNKMADFITNFAARYISAYDNYAAGNMSAVSGPWKIYFDFVMSNHSDTTEDITLGMNAHINYDLAIVTFEQGYAVPAWTADYYRVNDLMSQVDNNITYSLGRYDAQFYNTDFVSEVYFTGSVQLVTSWRTYAYTTAVTYQTAATALPILGGATVPALEAASQTAAVAAAVPMAIPYPYNTQTSRYAYCMTQNQQPIFSSK